MQLIPVGYGNARHRELIERLMRDGLYRLVDTRMSPVSAVPGWHRTSLTNKYGDRYISLGKYLGNKNYNVPGAPIEIANLDTGLVDLLAILHDYPVLLLCGCGDYERCHRKVICEAAARCEIEVITPEALTVQERLTALQHERVTLELSRPTLKNYWGLSATDQQMLRREGGLKR